MNKHPNLKLGDHLKVKRALYTHEGIYAGRINGVDHVIHFAESTPHAGKHTAKIRRTTLAEFALGDEVYVDRNSPANYSGEQIVARAQELIGTGNYQLLNKNCEHFATFCRTGAAISNQANLLKFVLLVGIAPKLYNDGLEKTLRDVLPLVFGYALIRKALK